MDEVTKKKLEVLEAQVREIEKQKIELLQLSRAGDLETVKSLIKTHGFSAGDCGFSLKTKKKGEEKPAKYRHPDNPELTWAGGKGRTPSWVTEWKASGKNIEDCLIKQS